MAMELVDKIDQSSLHLAIQEEAPFVFFFFAQVF